jgi:hypothetical protein
MVAGQGKQPPEPSRATIVDNSNLYAWFQRRHGRQPASFNEAFGAYTDERLRLNPDERRVRDEVVAYAEAQGGTVLAFAQLKFAQYWHLGRPTPVAQASQQVGIDVDAGWAMVAQIYDGARTAVTMSPEWRSGRPSVRPRVSVDLNA